MVEETEKVLDTPRRFEVLEKTVEVLPLTAKLLARWRGFVAAKIEEAETVEYENARGALASDLQAAGLAPFERIPHLRKFRADWESDRQAAIDALSIAVEGARHAAAVERVNRALLSGEGRGMVEAMAFLVSLATQRGGTPMTFEQVMGWLTSPDDIDLGGMLAYVLPAGFVPNQTKTTEPIATEKKTFPENASLGPSDMQ